MGKIVMGMRKGMSIRFLILREEMVVGAVRVVVRSTIMMMMMMMRVLQRRGAMVVGEEALDVSKVTKLGVWPRVLGV